MSTWYYYKYSEISELLSTKIFHGIYFVWDNQMV